MKDKIEKFIDTEKRAAVTKAREINKIMSARCQVNAKKACPTALE